VNGVKNHQIIATGYNGSIAGLPHCDDVGHKMENNHCVRTIHAEINALLQAAKHGVTLEGATCYSTASPCRNCTMLLVQAGVKKFVYGEPYRDDLASSMFREELNIHLGIKFFL
jgi:dCMP deaminase